MRITKLDIFNYRGISHVQLTPASGMNVFIGENGAGKSSILDAAAIALSWYTSRSININANGWGIGESDIRNGEREARISIEIEIGGRVVAWTIYGYRKGPGERKKGDYAQLNTFLDEAGQRFERGQSSIPLVAYYPTTRAFVDVPERIRTKHMFTVQTAAYEGSLAVGADFRNFFEWYKDQEDLENELLARPDEIGAYAQSRLREVRRAIEAFTGFHDLRIKRRPSVRMLLKQGDADIEVSQLSDGEQIYLALVGDIARRAAIAHPIGDPLTEIDGIVLIDEVELHLHPRWQREVLPRLTQVFPNLQFIVTTHSPQVVGEVARESSWKVHRGGETEPLSFAYGATSDSILENIMGGSERSVTVKERIASIYRSIDDSDYVKANAEVEELEKFNEHEPEIARIRVILSRKELLGR
jgi:predicted ATP-binding protein involved in virulence